MSKINWYNAQTALRASGFYTGTVDGIPGPMTYTGLLRYQVNVIRTPLEIIGSVASNVLPVYGWDQSAERLAEWIAETSHETGGYLNFEENLSYSAARLRQVWPSRFPDDATAQQYAHNPEALANYVYGDRMGNTGPNDGWVYRGGGLLQHTGRNEYARLSARLGFSPDNVRHPGMGVIAACDYLLRVKAQNLIDAGDWKGVRRAINGGYIGLEDIEARRARMLRILV